MTTPTGQKKAETLACLIIDDPLLKPRYGCLDYEKLLEKMKVHNFFTEIAFIPWNYKRSNDKTVQLFSSNPDYYAICVHGCNHTSNEFGGRDYRELTNLSSTALWYMEQHKKLTGLPYDPVMVFPQGRFSSVAMKALKDQGYFAAFNSTIQATDWENLPTVESQSPAVKTYHDLPLFLRRYPKDKSHFVKDLALGHPIIIVAHHGDFIKDYKGITDLVDWINALGIVKWTSLLDIAEHYLGKKAVITGINADLSQSGLRLNPKVVLRRFLSEARDNYVETNAPLTRLYKMIRR